MAGKETNNDGTELDQVIGSELTATLLESIDIGVYVVDDDYNILFWNSFMEKYTGKSRTDVLGMNLFEYFTHLKDTGWPDNYARVFEEAFTFRVFNSPAMYIPRVLEHHGGVFHNIRLYPLFAKKGEVRGVLTLLEDVTDRKMMEERSQELFEYASDAIFIMNGDGRFTYVNQRAVMELGLGKEEIIGKFFSDIVDPSSLDSVATAFDRLLQGDEVRGLQCTIVDPSGRKVNLDINASPIRAPDSKEITAFQGIARNITARKKIEDEIKEIKELAERILSTIPSGVLVVDRHLTIHSVNDAFCRTFISSEKDALGKNLVDFLPANFFGEEGQEDRVSEVLEKIRAGGTYVRNDVAYKNAKNELRLDFEIVPLPGQESRALVIIDDVTEREKLEEQRRERIKLQTEVDKLKEVDEMKSRFISVASHELRTPLTGIMLYLERLSDGKYCMMTELHRTKVVSVMEQIKLLAKIVDEMLDTTRLEAKLEDIRLEPCLINDIISRSVLKMISQAENKSQRIELHIPDNIPKIQMDPDRIERVISNLVKNAINYSPDNTLIQIEAYVDHEKNNLVVKVIDEGPGIQDIHKEKIFGRFYVIDKSLTRQVGGLGLGLSIAKGIVENHGGKLWVEDGAKKGSVFIFTLPIVPETK
jgi:PAS domain S-box-containing protein